MRSCSLYLFLHLARLHFVNTNIIETQPLNIQTQAFPESTADPPNANGSLKDNPACIILGIAIGICASLTPGFTTLQPTSQARCLCYSSTSWQPNVFDAAVKTCADYASTVVPTAYVPIANLQGFCNDMGDVEAAPSTYSTSTTMGGFGGKSCSPVNSYLNSCAASTPGFATLLAKDQAKCLCYFNSTWAPSSFDEALNICCKYAQTAEPSVYSIVSALGGFCQSVGNILATTTTAASLIPTTLTATISPIPSGGATSTSMLTTLTTTTSSNPKSEITSPSSVQIKASTTHTAIDTTVLTPIATETGKSTAVSVPVSLTEVIFVSFGIALVLIFL